MELNLQQLVSVSTFRQAPEDARLDGALVNVLTGMGTTKDKTVFTSVAANHILTQESLEALYVHGIPRRYVDAIGDAIFRHQTTITLGNDDQGSDDIIPAFEEHLKNTKFHHALSEVVKLQRLYGGAGLVLLIDDGLDPSEPVDVNRIRAVRGYVPFSRHELVPSDVSYTDWSKPEHYRLTTSQKLSPDQQTSYVNILIHHTRIARFDGLYLPWRVRSQNTGWGMPVLQLLWESYKRYESALSGLESMTSDADMFVHKIPGLFQRIASGNEADLRKRLEANSLSRSVYGGLVVDTEEDVQFLARALSNIASATDPFVKDLQAATGWPASILMGDSPGGLGKEGRFEERTWAGLVEQWQEVYCRTPITEVFQYILASKEGPTRGRPPESWSVHFPSVYSQTDEEKAALRVQVAGVDIQYINAGVLNALEVRESRFGGTNYSMETVLNSTISEQLEAQADMNFESQMMNFNAQAEALRNPQNPEDLTQPEASASGSSDLKTQEEEEITATMDPRMKRDSFDSYELRGLRIRVSHEIENIRAGYLVAPDGQRIDSSSNAPLFVFGPHRSRSYRVYRSRFEHDSELRDGPYVTGFASVRAAKQGISRLFPGRRVAGMSPVPESDLQVFRAGWGIY